MNPPDSGQGDATGWYPVTSARAIAHASTDTSEASTTRLAISTFKHKRDNHPRPTSKTWDELAESLGKVRRAACTVADCAHADCAHKDGPAWSPASYADGATRGNANVIALSVTGLDVDHVTDEQLRDAIGKLRAHQCIIHATHSDRPEDRCVRVVLAQSRPVSVEEWPRYYAAVVAKLALPGVDPATKDAARLFFAPSRPSDAEYLFLEHPGEVLDVDELLATAPVLAPTTRPTLVEVTPDDADEDMIRPGGRHAALISLAGAMRARGCDAATIYAALVEHNKSKCNPPKPDDELRELAGYMAGKPDGEDTEHQTELGNARRFAAMHGERLRYVFSRGEWFAWDGRRWARDQLGTADAAGKRVVMALYMTAATLAHRAANDPHVAERADEALKWARKSSKASAIRAMVTLAQSEAPIAATGEQFDHDRFALNCANGTIDLRTGVLRPHRQADMITRLAPVAYDPNATAPMWEAFLARVLPDEDVREFVQRYAGYCLTGDVGEQVLAFLFGLGANGKSVLLDVLLALLGDYAHRAAPELVLAKHNEAHPTELADLEGRRLIVCSEIEQGRAWAESTIKRITGDTTITARRMRQDFYTFQATHKLVIAANTRPMVRGSDHAIWRRMRLVPFEVTIPPEERDKGLVGKLVAAEGPGILAWAVRGCLAWQRDGLGTAAAVDAATEGYRAEQDVIGLWLAEACMLGGGLWAPMSTLYESYVTWCKDGGREPWTRDTLRARLLERPGLADKRSKIARGIDGVALRSDRVQFGLAG